MLEAACYIFYVEFILLLRRSQAWLYPLGFFVIVISLFPIAFTPDPAFLQKYLPGCIWIAALFASLLSIENIFLTDNEDAFLEQLLLSQIPLSVAIMSKLAAHWVVAQLPLIFLTPVLCALFHLPLNLIAPLLACLFLGTPILTLLGALSVALTLGLKQPGVLLGLLMLPLAMPVLIFGVNTVHLASVHLPFFGSLMFLAGLFVLAITLLPSAIAACLRISMER